MTQAEYIAEFEKLAQEMVALTRKKNADYGEELDGLANLRLIEAVSGKRISAAAGVLVRLTDKLKRVGGLLARDAQVTDEKLEDTLMDAAVYSLIMIIVLREAKRDGAQIAAQQKDQVFQGQLGYQNLNLNPDLLSELIHQYAQNNSVPDNTQLVIDPNMTKAKVPSAWERLATAMGVNRTK